MAKKLTRTDQVTSGDLVVLYKTSAGDYRGISAADFVAYMQASLTFPGVGQGEYATQYSAPSATGFNVTITDGADDNTNVHLILTPTAGYAAGTITLPPVAGVVDKQEVLVNCTQQVTSLTVDGNGATAVTGEPSSLAADDFFRLKYDLPTQTWYRVG
jgi:hypothetical protein